jgi:hypothetical protein
MQRTFIIVTIVGLLALGVAIARPATQAQLMAAQEATPGTAATPTVVAGELEDLRDRVSELSTQVAELGGADAEAVAGRLGGSRAGFDDRYGRPVTYVEPHEVAYAVPDVGRVTVTFTGDKATSIILTPPRAPDLPFDQPDPADWPQETALSIATRFYPADAITAAPSDSGGATFAVSGSSQALTGAITPTDTQGCPASGATAFMASFSRTSAGTISAVVIETAPPSDTSLLPVEPVPPEQGQLSQGGARAVANSSLGGTVSVNGITVVATAAQPGATGPRPVPAGYQLYTVDLRIENQTAQPLTYKLSDFILVDRRDNEATAICGGVEPAITSGELAAGSGIDGVVTFEVPEGYRAVRFVVLVNGARAGFNLR